MPPVLLVAEGSRFAGIEAHLQTLLETAIPLGGLYYHLAVFDEGPLVQRAKNLGIPVHVIHRRNRYDRSAITQLREIILQTGAALVHTHGYLANIVAAQACQTLNAPLVTTVHGLPEYVGVVNSIKMRFNIWMDRRAMRGPCRRVITVASFLRDFLVNKGIPPKKISVILNGLVDHQSDQQQQHDNRRELELLPDSVAIVFVGRIEAVKNPLAFVEFARLVHDRQSNTRFLVAGDGPLLEAMRRRVVELNLLPSFRFLGFVDDLESLLAVSDLLVLTSRSEGTPMIVLEAMRAGKPVIAPAIGGLPELLGSQHGLMAPAGDYRQLAALAIMLMRDKQHMLQIGQQLRDRFVEHFTAARMINQLKDVYQAVVQGEI